MVEMEKVYVKMRKLMLRVYLTEFMVLALASLFAVPKGTEDTQMVFDANLYRLNRALWDPNCMLSVMGSLIIMVGSETHMLDLYVGEMFYNFRLSSGFSNSF